MIISNFKVSNQKITDRKYAQLRSKYLEFL